MEAGGSPVYRQRRLLISEKLFRVDVKHSQLSGLRFDL
jgi:hypothetical protein